MTKEDIETIALAIAIANNHPQPKEWVALVLEAFDNKPVDPVDPALA